MSCIHSGVFLLIFGYLYDIIMNKYYHEVGKVDYRKMLKKEIDMDLFKNFRRRQVVTKCLRNIDGHWIVKDDPFIDDWGEEDYKELVSCLINTVDTGGAVFGAFCSGILKGFVSVESKPFGKDGQYLDLSSIHVSEESRGKGAGRELFSLAAEWAKAQGAKKLYISSHSAFESQSFYKSMGCVEAEEYNMEHVEKEPYDCQLEYVLK